MDWSNLIVGVLAPATTLGLAMWQIRRNNKKIRADSLKAQLSGSDEAAQAMINQLQEQLNDQYTEFRNFKIDQAKQNERRDRELERLRDSEGAWRQYAFKMERWANKAYIMITAEGHDIEPIPQAPNRLR